MKVLLVLLLGAVACVQNVSAGATCWAMGDPHYLTFDGKRYDFMGRLSYYMVKHPTFSVVATHSPCGNPASVSI
jgi:von Willebrand factor